jgi:hypothetical protein
MTETCNSCGNHNAKDICCKIIINKEIEKRLEGGIELFPLTSVFLLLILESSFLLDSQLATVITAFRANGVRNMPATTVGAYYYGRNNCLVMRTALGCTGVRLSSFRMCHFYYY